MDNAKKLLGLVLAVVGLVLAVLGGWFATNLGTAGTATFTAHPTGAGPVVIEPAMLARVDVPTVVSVRAPAGTEIWLGQGAPSDVRAAIGTTPATRVTGAEVRDWALLTRHAGSGTPVTLATLDLWRTQSTARDAATATVTPSGPATTLVIETSSGHPTTVELTWSRGRWFFQALVVGLVGLMVAAVGVALAWPTGRRRTDEESRT